MGLFCSIIVAVFVLSSCSDFCSAIDKITSSEFIKDPEAIVSADNTFKLGFFSPVNTKNRYVGIWYNAISTVTPIWVANRNKPLHDSSGIMKVSEDGDLVVLNGQKEVLWKSNVSSGNSSASLTNDGSLVLQDNTTGNIIWESFWEPTNVLVKNMKINADRRTGEKTMFTSWKNPSDPSIGSFSLGINPVEIPELFIWNGTIPYWRSGPWNGQIFMGIAEAGTVINNRFSVGDENGSISLSFTMSQPSITYHYVLNSDGAVSTLNWDNITQSWRIAWQGKKSECDVYGKCGPFGVCNAKISPFCSCLTGFDPKNAEQWRKGNWTDGCIRRKSLQCERIKNGSDARKQDGFLKMENMKVPYLANGSTFNEQECKENCLKSCSCVAYSYYPGFACMSWTTDLIDLQKFSSGGTVLHIRLESSELGDKKNVQVKIIIIPIGVIILLICAIILIWRWKTRHREIKRTLILERVDKNPTFSDVKKLIDNMNQEKLSELSVFSIAELANATNNFHVTNKLGEGGFGAVYKGKLGDGQEIAVKRLSRASGQGLQEFVNEVVVISKLQHRNLVKLLGCYVEGEEKMLVYEYMPNKSLDSFIFDPNKKELLDWGKRFQIIEGICRGLLYLHRDSRFKIIHRDLKAGNILLDQNLNPKIADFGMARIFGGNEDQANTNRIVGTYGYMPPEYAMEGRFSEKLDVFSLGVLLLEIVSGRRNTSFYGNEQALSLVGFAWKLWNEGEVSALVDPVLADPSNKVEIFWCVQVGLLCVQELAKERPAVSTIISMLNSEIGDIPIPKRPAFAERQASLNSEISQLSQKTCSVNMVTVTVVNGR